MTGLVDSYLLDWLLLFRIELGLDTELDSWVFNSSANSLTIKCFSFNLSNRFSNRLAYLSNLFSIFSESRFRIESVLLGCSYS